MDYYTTESAFPWVAVIVPLVVFWIICGIACAFIAKTKYRDPVGYFVLGLLLGVIGLIIIAAVPKLSTNEEIIKAKSFAATIKCIKKSDNGDLEGKLFCDETGITFTYLNGGTPQYIPFAEVIDIYKPIFNCVDIVFNQDEQKTTARFVTRVGQSIGSGETISSYVNHRLIPLWKSYMRQPVEERSAGDTKKCPYCAETIKAEAIKCKHCGSDLTEKD